MPKAKMPVPVLLILTIAPALLIGATLWLVASLVPACVVIEKTRLASPDNRFDLVTFSRDCGDGAPNIQAALVPNGEEVPFDAASFFSMAADADIAPRWENADTIGLTVPPAREVLRQDETVAGIDVNYD